IVQGEPVEVQRPLFRGLLRPASTMTSMQAQPMPSPAPGPAAPAPVQGVAPTNGDMTAPPTALNGNCGGGECCHDPTDRFWFIGEYLLWRFGSVPLPDFNANVSAGQAIVFSRNASVSPPAAPVITDTILNVPVSVTVNTGLPGGK